jgi:hypothetical protein
MFDLDGTLLPMNQNEFVKIYFEGLTNKFIPKGYEPKKLMESIWLGIKEMVKNDGSLLNEKVFWNKISSIYGNKIYDEKPSFEEYYLTDFIKAKEACNFTNKANEIIKLSKNLGYKVGLSVKPNTSLDKIKPYLDMIDLILVMSVEPGLGGQGFITTTVDRISELRELIGKRKILIEVDGGINEDNITLLDKVDISVVGSYIVKSDNYNDRVNTLLDKFNNK